MRTAISRHLHSILDQTQELHCQLVDVQDVTEDHLNVLQQETWGKKSDTGWNKTTLDAQKEIAGGAGPHVPSRPKISRATNSLWL